MSAGEAAATTSSNLPLLPADPLGVRFCHYFNYSWHYIVAPVPDPGKRAQWKTETRHPLNLRNLWQEYQNPEVILGLRFGPETRYLMLDIDRGSQYHPQNNPEKFESVLWALEDIGLCRWLAIQSSYSEGLHVYFFLPKPVKSFGLAIAAKFALNDAGLILQAGQIESFPNAKPYNPNRITDYNAHRLPLQRGTGSILLNHCLVPISEDLSRFLNWADVDAAHQDIERLEEAIAAALTRHKSQKYRPAASDKGLKWKQHLEASISQGWTGPGQTNDLLRELVCYGKVWLNLSGEALIDYVVNTAINAPGYTQYCAHQHEIRNRAAQRVHSTESNQFYTPYCSIPPRKATYRETYSNDPTPEAANNVVPFSTNNPTNEQRSAMALERVQQAIAHLEAKGSLPDRVEARISAIISTVKELTGIRTSNSTLYKENCLPLWHPKFRKEGSVNNGEGTVTAIPDPPNIPDDNSSANFIKSPEPLSELDSGKNSAPPPLYEGFFGEVSAPVAHQNDLELRLLNTTESQDKNVVCLKSVENTERSAETIANCAENTNQTPQTVTDCVENTNQTPQTVTDCVENADLNPSHTILEINANTIQISTADSATERQAEAFVNSDSDSDTASQATTESVLDVTLLKLLTKIRLEAKVKAQKQVKLQMFQAARYFSREERERLETLTKMQFLWKSGQPLLMAEVMAWAEATEGVVMTSAGPFLISEADAFEEDLQQDS